MTDQLFYIARFIINAFIHIWPYLLITIPVSVAVKMSGAAKYINKALSNKPHIAIILATLVGAFSPFCSCGVIPVVATLLLGGVPLAPVMSFWIASPSMDPEIFFLSVATLGWNLALWRLSSTLVLSLGAGYVTHLLMKKGWLGEEILLIGKPRAMFDAGKTIKAFHGSFVKNIQNIFSRINPVASGNSKEPALCCQQGEMTLTDIALTEPVIKIEDINIYKPGRDETNRFMSKTELSGNLFSGTASSCSCGNKPEGQKDKKEFFRKLKKESIEATVLVIKFMGLAFLLEALIVLYVPKEFITKYLGGSNLLSVLWASLLGVPVYTSNLTALPLIGGLLQQGMNPGAALAFLISGPITTIPAMAAVWGLVKKKVFFLYVSFAFFGALIFGYLFCFISLM